MTGSISISSRLLSHLESKSGRTLLLILSEHCCTKQYLYHCHESLSSHPVPIHKPCKIVRVDITAKTTTKIKLLRRMKRNLKVGPRADKKMKTTTYSEQKISKMGPKKCQTSPTRFNSPYSQLWVVNFYIQARQFRMKLMFDSLT